MELRVKNPWFQEIKMGRKIIEGRAGTLEKFAKVVGCPIVFSCGDETLSVRAVRVKHYKTVREYLESEGWEKAAPHLQSLEQALSAYSEIYSESVISQRGGIVAIELGCFVDA